MAKSKSFFGLRRGSTKSHTYSVFNGQQVTKDRVEEVKNPRSQTQMLQRMVLKTAGQAYSNMKQIVDHSFEGKTYGLQSMMAFMSANAKLMRDCAIKAYNGETVTEDGFLYNYYQSENLEPGCYIISRGSASPIAIAPVLADGAAGQTVVKLTEAANKATTAADLFALLGINVGELCTVCVLWGAEIGEPWHFDFLRITALASGDVALTSENYSTYIKLESTLGIASVAFGTADTPNGINVTLTTPHATGSTANTAVAIHSVQSDGKWLRSNTQFDVDSIIDVGATFEDALASYPVGNTYVLNGGNF